MSGSEPISTVSGSEPISTVSGSEPISTVRGTEPSDEHGPTLLSKIDRSNQALISNPLRFPWELLEVVGSKTPLVVDVSGCSPADITALRPMLRLLGAHDTIINTAMPNDPVALELSQEFHTRSVLAAPTDQPALRQAKAMDQIEDTIVGRLGETFRVNIVEWADAESKDSVDWTDASGASAMDQRPRAVVVRVPASAIRASRSGFAALLDRLVTATSGTAVLDVSGVRETPGAPLARALVTIGIGS